MRLADVVFESGRFFVSKAKAFDGFEVYECGATAATRVARIGYPGEEGLRRAKAEVERREKES